MATRILFASLFVTLVRGSTHWVVTEEGKVQEQLESPFVINQPHDLVAFMKQEKNYQQVEGMKEILIEEKKKIEENEDKDLELESNHYKKDEDCKTAGKPLDDFDLFISSALPLENKDISVADFIDTSSPETGTVLAEPDCNEAYPLPHSVHSYDHLEGVKNRNELQYLPESGLRTTLKYMKSEAEFANAVHTALQKNSSSWVAYNLATFYWRMRGRADKALECTRRALHFSPQEYKDVALVNLANILHRSHYSLNASVVMTHALDISSQFSVNHFTLGCIYAALGKYNRSIECLERTVQDQPEFDAARKRLHAVKCQNKLQHKLELQHESLQRTLEELQVYQEKHKKFLELQNLVEKMQLSRQEQINMHFLLMQYMIKQGTFDHSKCKFKSNESGPVLFCNLPTPETAEKGVDLGVDERSHILEARPTTFATNSEAGTFKAPETTQKVDYNNWNDPAWPTPEHCAEYAPRNLAWDEYPSSYINPQSRGFTVNDLLTSYIGVEEGENLPHPWTPLNCETLEPISTKTKLDLIPSVVNRHSAPMHKQDEYMKREMLMHANEGHVWPGDLAHRVHVAIAKAKKNKDEDNLWLLYNYAGLYFRVHGDNLKAIECIRRAGERTPPEHYDVPLVNLANILYRLGKVNDALSLLIEALAVNNTEPVTYLAMGNALQAKGNLTGAIEFYEYGLLLRPTYWECFHALINVKCAAIRDETVQQYEKKLRQQVSAKAKTKKQKSAREKQKTCEKKEKECSGDKKEKCGGSKVASKPEKVTDSTVQSSNQDVYSYASQVDRENISNKNDLVRKLESQKKDADRMLQDADDVIRHLTHLAKDGSEELSVRMSTVMDMVAQLSEMRDSLGSLVEEASSTIGVATPSEILEKYSPSECAESLHSVDVRTYISLNFDVRVRGYEFGEELPPYSDKTPPDSQPICVVSNPLQVYNVDHLDTIRKRNSFKTYTKEHGMRTLLEQVLPEDDKHSDLHEIIGRLSEGLKLHPSSWRLAILGSHYWRLHGKAKQAINCLRLALSNAPLEMRDVVFIAMANVFAQLSQWKDAVYATEQAIKLFPEVFLHHFTLANVLAAKGDIQRSIPHFRRVLDMEPDLEIAQQRLQAAVCELQMRGNH